MRGQEEPGRGGQGGGRVAPADVAQRGQGSGELLGPRRGDLVGEDAAKGVQAAAVQPRSGITLHGEAVQQYIRERMAGYKVPAVVTFHDALPREDTGKIFKRKLREPYWAGRSRRV